MSRAKIGGLVAVAVAALTSTAYYLTTANLEARIRKDVEERVGKSLQLLMQNASFEGFGLMRQVETFARDERFPKALDEPDVVTRAQIADEGFRKFLSELKPDEAKPDFLALVDAEGKVAAMQDAPRPEPEDWKARFPSVGAALDKRQVTKDIWDFRNGVLKVGVAPIYDPVHGGVKGALVVATALNSKEAQAQSARLGMDVAYFVGDRVRTTSFRRGGAEEDVAKQQDLAGPLFDKGLAKTALERGQAANVIDVRLGNEDYVATAGRMPLNYSDKTSGAMVLMSLTKAREPIAAVRVTIIALGAGALLIAIIAMLVTARLILVPAEEIEFGVTEIINGNVDYTFKPAGADFDGLANALNVMLARLLGRPEPGEEEADENGNIPASTTVLLDDDLPAGGVAALGGGQITDPETLALAQEPEADYYRRLFNGYVEARKGVGERVDGVVFEGFIAKLRMNEANMRKKYNCRAVRFRVQTKGDQVTLKPVPIF